MAETFKQILIKITTNYVETEQEWYTDASQDVSLSSIPTPRMAKRFVWENSKNSKGIWN